MRCVLMLGVVFAIGCNDGFSQTPPNTTKIRGVATLPSGEKLTKGFISFHPTNLAVGRENFCEVKNGNYEIDIVPSNYKVAIEPYWKRMATKPIGSNGIPKKFWEPDTSGLVYDVKENDTLNIKLK